MGTVVSQISPGEITYSARGIARYSRQVLHTGLNKHQVIRGDSGYLVDQKSRLKAAEWDAQWATREAREATQDAKALARMAVELKKGLAARLSNEATETLDGLSRVLMHTLHVDDRIDWEVLTDKSPFPESEPVAPKMRAEPEAARMPIEPEASFNQYAIRPSMMDRFIPGRIAKLEAEAKERFENDHSEWVRASGKAKETADRLKAAHRAVIRAAKSDHTKKLNAWQERRDAFLAMQVEGQATIEKLRRAYIDKDPVAITEYCDLVLSASQYADFFPHEFELQYNESARTMIVDYRLPAPDDLPTLKAVRFVASRQAIEESHITEMQKLKLFDDVAYQVALRTVHELFEADVVQALDAVAFNGIVQAVDKATGNEVIGCIMSLRTGRAEFMTINLHNVDPKACFKALKGVSSSKLSGLAPVAPVMPMQREDARFVSSYEVAKTLDSGVNLAAMDWEDFEHLIREIFEKEFAVAGGEVRVTQASRDGGVDAVIFDPDPIRGGKIIVQAKRWTNTVGVAAVRDLYGTVMAEGANKGVLVTTADYGPDSYAFATGKPLVLINGANLLHMLARHGHEARINIQEARRSA